MKYSIALTVALCAATAVQAQTPRTTEIKTHPSQGEVGVVEDAIVRQIAYEDGMFVNIDTNGLTPGHVHTLWFVAINNPAGCFDPDAVAKKRKKRAEDCTSFDVLKRTTMTDSDVGYAGGVVVGKDGNASFSWHQPTGDLNAAWFGNGLKSARQSEIHLVINDHGPVINGRVGSMLSTYRDGCADESIPKPMPATARADGEAGPNTCRLVQFAILKPTDTAS